MTQEIQEAFEKFCDDYKLNFKVSEGINLYDFFKAGVDYANKHRFDCLFETNEVLDCLVTEKMPDPDKTNWYMTDNGPRYFALGCWYRRGSELIDMGDEMCIVGRPYSWSEM